jgi:hypothetical protein
MTFNEKDFWVPKRITIDEFKIFCRECSVEIDVRKSESMKKVCAVKKKRTSY